MPSLAAQKKKLETEKADLERRLQMSELRADDAEARAENAEAVLEAPRPAVEIREDGVAVQTRVHEQTAQEPELLYDPFDSKNPHKIISNPSGFKLGWKNPMYRENHRGWRGWITVSYEDDIGKNLGKYLLDPPRKMSHHDDLLVRRGDVILCKLPEDMWLARQKARTDRASRNRLVHAPDITVDKTTLKDLERGPQPGFHAPNSVGGRTMTS